MWATDQKGLTDRVASAFAALVVQAALACLFLFGMGSEMRQAFVEPLRLINILPSEPEPELIIVRPPPREASETKAKRFTPREEGGSSAPNLRSQASPVVAPNPVVPLPLRPPIAVAPVRGRGNDPSQGAALVRGPGTGSGGFGNGTGSGRGGDGGGGGGYNEYRPPRQIRGRLRDSDYPPGLGEAGFGGRVGVIFIVRANGRVTDCRIRESSGIRVLDETTCRLIEQRFFFEPSLDPYGRPIDSRVVESHTWLVEDDPYEEEPRIRRRRGLF
jgi:periplasmic protein TonB